MEALEIREISIVRLVLADSMVEIAGVGELELAGITPLPSLECTEAVKILVEVTEFLSVDRIKRHHFLS